MKRVVHAALASLLAVGGAVTVASNAEAADETALVVGPPAVGVRAGVSQSLTLFGRVGDAPLANTSVSFEVIDGPSTGTNGTVATNENGEVTFRYGTTALVPGGGTDLVRAWVDADANGAFDEGEPTVTTDLVTLPSVNLPPLAGEIETSVPGNETTSIRLSGSDPDGGRVGFSIAAQPQHGTVPTSLTGPFVDYTPVNGFVGADEFTYRVTDSDAQSTIATVRVEVRATEVPVEASCNGRAATIVVEPGQETVTGTDGPDVIVGTPGAERIDALAGDDIVCGNGGADEIHAGTGNDYVLLGTGHATVYADDGDDRITGDGAYDVHAGNGNDKVDVGSGSRVWGNDGDDKVDVNGRADVWAGNGNDWVKVTAGRSEIAGEDGDDTLTAVGTRATIWGGRGHDTVTNG